MAAPWFNTNWTFRKKITADNTLVAATETDFPALVSITDLDLRDDAQNDGDDIVFTSDDGITQIPHELERFDGATGELVAWVKIPSLSASVDTDIYMYYGNAAAVNQEDPTNVWDVDYQGVWHLKEDPGPGGAGDIKDSTANANNLTAEASMTAADLVEGQIDGAIDFDGGGAADDVLSGGDVVDVPGTNLTLSIWVDPRSFPGTNRFLILKGQEDGNAPQNYQLLTRTGGGIDFDFFNVTFNTHQAPAGSLVVGFPQYVVVTYDGVRVKMYVDAVLLTDDAETTAMLADAEDFALGGAVAPVATRTQDAVLDEARVSDIARTDDWITTEFNNQKGPITDVSRLGAAASADTPTLAHTVPAGQNRMLVACFSHEINGQTAVTSVDYGGQAMVQAVQLDTPDSGFSAGASIWYLLEAEIAAASTNIITPTYSTGPAQSIIHAQAYAGVNQTGGATTNPATNSAESNESTPNPLIADLTETDDGAVVAINASGNNSSTIWLGGATGMTERTDQNAGSSHSSMADRLSDSNSNVDIEGTVANQNRAVTCSASFAPAPPSGAFFTVDAEEKVRNRAYVMAS